jgi:murein DD-endopeptidase MepM/ murein hydrolase activator NlpD
MLRRIVLAIALGLALAAPALADLSDRKESVDAKIERLRDRVAGLQERESVLRGQISEVTTEIRALERRVGDVSVRYDALRRDLYLHEVRLARLTELFELQTERLEWLRAQYRVAWSHLSARLRGLYEDGVPGTLDIVFSSASFSEMLDQLDYLREIGAQDRRISDQVESARANVALARERTLAARDGVRAATRTVAARTSQVKEVRDALLADRNALAERRHRKAVSLAALSEEERQELSEIQALERESATLAARIRAAQAAAAPSPGPAPDSTASAAGFVWPAGGSVTSAFGWRWGRMHEGIDIGAGYGSPIYAAASGTVIFASWMGGYGYLTVVDHGGGVATAYAHQPGTSVSVGQTVSRGQVIGSVGCTGHCFGAHLHFEVRVNGAAYDPLGYL